MRKAGETVKDKFASYHPVINFTFFLGALICGMLLLHSAFLFCSVFLSMGYYLTVQGRKGVKMVFHLMLLFALLSVINPLFNTYGKTVLFTYLGGRTYTLEALGYGMALAAMMVSVLFWFASYNAVMTSDKFLYLFGSLAPSVTLVLTMVLRLLPLYRDKAVQMNSARRCIGKDAKTGAKKEQAEHGMTILSALTSWALEGGVITADSMRSRGYGCGKRSSFSLYRFEGRDKSLLSFMTALLGIVIFCCLHGGASVVYTPVYQAAGVDNPFMHVGVAAYFLFLFLPSAVNVWEEIRWCSLKSKI